MPVGPRQINDKVNQSIVLRKRLVVRLFSINIISDLLWQCTIDDVAALEFAKDKGTGKEQKITIQASGGLSDEDIEAMVQDAEANAEADKERRELVDAKNQAESLIHSTEKSMEEHADKVDPTTIEAIELAIAALKDDLETENADKIKSGVQNVTEAAMKLGEAIYKAQAEEAEAGAEAAEAGGDDDVVDADFEDLEEDEKS